MVRPFIPEINYIRGICMIAVVAIHVGSYALSNPAVSTTLIGVLEILTRFSIPGFFFLSGFVLFYNTPIATPFHSKQFMIKRFHSTVLPYCSWSVLYVLYQGILSHNYVGLYPQYFIPALFFGNTSYHLYFMVILFWFYFLTPLWRILLKGMLKNLPLWLLVGGIAQLIFNYASSYYFGKIHFASPILEYLWSTRLNYWVLHYLFIFLLGGVFAEKYIEVLSMLQSYRLFITSVFALSLVAMLGSYYYVQDVWGYRLLEAVYTVHQLSPIGNIYTITTLLFLILLFHWMPLSPTAKEWWHYLGNTSFGIYLIHPFILYFITPIFTLLGYTYTVPNTFFLYITTILLSALATNSLEKNKLLANYLLGKQV